MMKRIAGLVLALMALPAAAHTIGVSRGEYQALGSSVEAKITFARGEVVAMVPELDANGDRSITPQELAAARERVGAVIVGGLDVHSAGGSCAGSLQDATLTEQDGLAVHMEFRCPDAAETFSVRLPLLGSLSQGHRHLAAAKSGGQIATSVVYEANPQFSLASAGATAMAQDVGVPLFKLGIEHILTGYDHLVFLLGVILVGGTVRSLLVVITAFTVAHSLTLGLAALGVLAPSPSLVEPAIALSISYVGVENWFVRDATRRWLLTFPFGLIHGFGFAGALQEIALPKAQIPLALVSFNAGVEVGQLLVLALVLPLLLWLRRRPWFVAQGVRAVSAVIVVAGAVWFVQRVF